MLAYRHAFHAGNHADVLKHLVLVQVLRRLAGKDKPFTLVDTEGDPILLTPGRTFIELPRVNSMLPLPPG